MNWDPDSYDRNSRFVSELGMPVVGLLQPAPGERILDLGCGDGALTIKLMNIGCRVTGIDASKEMVAAAVQRGVDAQVEDGHNLPFDREFDAVFSNAELHWMLQPDRVVAGVWRSLETPERYVGEMGGQGNVDKLNKALLQAMASRGVAPNAVDPWYFPSTEEYGGKLAVAPEEHSGLVAEVENQVRPFLCDKHGTWRADYVRLRFSASKTA